jgi:hypothetical protein
LREHIPFAHDEEMRMGNPGDDAGRPAEAAEFSEGEEADRYAAAKKKILRARPVAGEVDHEALTREIIARFPKILAELAK